MMNKFKKIISAIAAVAMLSSLFVIPASAETTLPYYVTDAYALEGEDAEGFFAEMGIEEDPDLSNALAAYTVYQVDVSLANVSWTNTQSSTTSTNKKKPEGTLPVQFTYKINFGSDASKLYAPEGAEDAGEGFIVVDPGIFGMEVNAYANSTMGFAWNAKTTLTDTYPILYNHPFVGTPDEPASLFSFQFALPKNASATAFVEDGSLISTGVYAKSTGYSSKTEISVAESTMASVASEDIVFGSSSPEPTTYTVSFGETSFAGKSAGDIVVAPAAPSAPTHQHFTGWSCDGGSTKVAAGANVEVTGNATYVACFENDPTYTVTFGDTPFAGKYAGETVEAPAAPTAPANKHFTGWSCDEGETKVAAGATVTVTGNATYVACFENDPQYTVTFKAGTETVSTITDYAGAAITAPNQAAVEAKYRPAGQHFTGWDVTPAATISATVTYNAVYADNQVAVTYSTDLTGVTGMPSNTTVVKGNTISVPSVTLPVDKKDATWTLNGEPFTSTYTVTGEEGAINIILAAADKAVVNVSVAGLPAELTAKLFDNGLAVTLDDVAKTSLGFTAMEGQVLKVTAAANFLPEYEFKGIKVNNVAKAVNEGVTVGTDAISVVLEYEFKQAVIDDGAEEFGIEPTTELNDTCYGFALAPANLFQDVANFKYIVKATDSNSETKEWDLTKFGGIDGISSNQEGYTEAKIKAEDFANMPSFYVVVRSTTHQITKVEIIKRAIED